MYAFLFVEALLGFLNMADFPPNLEDGEQWLPADIYHEIVYGSFEPKALADNTGEEGATEVWNEPINSSFEFSYLSYVSSTPIYLFSSMRLWFDFIIRTHICLYLCN